MKLPEFSCCHLLLESSMHHTPESSALPLLKDKQPCIVIGLADSVESLWLEKHVRHMNVGDCLSLTNSSTHALPISDGDSTATLDSSRISENESQETGASISVTLLSVERAKEAYQMTTAEKLENAQKLKECGSRLYRNKLINVAFQRYSQALKFAICAGPESHLDSQFKPHYHTLKGQCYFNMAACQITSGNFSAVIHNCTKGLQSDSGNVKGLYRRAQAFIKLTRYEEATKDLELASELEPLNKAVQKLLMESKHAVQRQHQNMASAMSKMFS